MMLGGEGVCDLRFAVGHKHKGCDRRLLACLVLHQMLFRQSAWRCGMTTGLQFHHAVLARAVTAHSVLYAMCVLAESCVYVRVCRTGMV
jgi:hypothetical protein